MTNKGNIYTADEGRTFIRKADSFIMGHCIDLGVDDSIANYEEVELTEANDIEGLLNQDKEGGIYG